MLIYAPRAQKDFLSLPKKICSQILDDLKLLENPPWPPGKVKQLRGQKFWEIKIGDYRTLFIPEKGNVIILRVVNRKDLEKAIKRIDIRYILQWIKQNPVF